MDDNEKNQRNTRKSSSDSSTGVNVSDEELYSPLYKFTKRFAARKSRLRSPMISPISSPEAQLLSPIDYPDEDDQNVVDANRDAGDDGDTESVGIQESGSQNEEDDGEASSSANLYNLTREQEEMLSLQRIERPCGSRYPESQFFIDMGRVADEIENNLPSLLNDSSEAIKFWERSQSNTNVWLQSVCEEAKPALQPYSDGLETRWIFIYICRCVLNYTEKDFFEHWKDVKEQIDKISRQWFGNSIAFHELGGCDDIFVQTLDRTIDSDLDVEQIASVMMEMWIGMIRDSYEKYVNVKLTGERMYEYSNGRDVWFYLKDLCKVIMNKQLGLQTVTAICSFLEKGPIASSDYSSPKSSELRNLLQRD